MKLQHKILATATILAASVSTASAQAAFMMNVGNIDGAIPAFLGLFADGNPYAADGNGTTIPGANGANLNPTATSVYTQQAGATQGLLLNGDILDFHDSGTNIINSFNNSLGQTLGNNTGSMEGYGTTWQLRVEYDVNGTATVVGQPAAGINMNTVTTGQAFSPATGLAPNFTGGTLKFYVDYIQPGANFWNGFLSTPFPNVADGTEVLELAVAGGAPDIGVLKLNGTVDYTNAGAWTDAAKNFFAFADGTSFYSLWDTAQAPTWSINTSVSDNLIPRVGTVGSNHVVGAPAGPCPNDPTSFCRSTQLNMSIAFETADPVIDVPEPDMTLLMSVGIMVFGFANAKHRRKPSAT
jgi:hypothetical protein